MSEGTIAKAHWSFWIISILLLIWNVLGSMNFFWQMLAAPDTLATLPETHRAIIEGRPVWATAGFAIGVVIGAFGCLMLLLKKSMAYCFFIVSLLGIIVTMIHTLDIAISRIAFTVAEIIVMIVMPLLVAVFLIWYSKLAMNKGWAR